MDVYKKAIKKWKPYYDKQFMHCTQISNLILKVTNFMK